MALDQAKKLPDLVRLSFPMRRLNVDYSGHTRMLEGLMATARPSRYESETDNQVDEIIIRNIIRIPAQPREKSTPIHGTRAPVRYSDWIGISASSPA